MNLRTCTLRFWPMRKARSVAWFSTAGFHHRSRWITWLAAVRFSPVPPGLQRQQEQRRAVAGLEPGHHLVAALLRGAPVQVEMSVPKRAARCGSSIAANSVNWVKHSALSPSARISSQDLLQPDHLAGPAPDGGAVVQQLRRVVAHLLELGHRGQHVAAPLDPLGVLDLLHHVVDDRLVERGLLGGERAVLLDLDLLRQVVDDGRVGLQPAQQVGPGDGAQPLGRLGLRRAARPGSRSGCGTARRARAGRD